MLGCAAVRPQAGDARPQPERKPEIIDVEVTRSFDVNPFGQGIPGCFVEEWRAVCRSDSKAVTAFTAKVVQQRGWGSRLEKSTLSDGCVQLKIRLGVDHKGPEGKVCNESFALMRVQLKLD
jgi:hypothetical protein